MWVLPTHKRPEKLLRFVKSVQSVDLDEHVVVIVWDKDPRMTDYAYTFSQLPRTWDVWIDKARTCGEKLNRAFDCFPNEAFYGLLTDDVQLGTVGMLKELRQDALRGKYAWPNDGIHGPRNATHGVAPGQFLRTLGFWAHPTFPHNGLDTVLYRISEAVGISCYRADLQLVVRHPLATAEHGEMDETYQDALMMNSKAVDDMYRFQERELPALIEKVKGVYGQTQG